MPLENQIDNAPKVSKDDWAKTCSILLDDAKPTGATCGERLGQIRQAEETMCTAMEAFAKNGFELVDTDKNGYLSPAETKKAIANTPAGVNRDVLKYIDKNANSIQLNSDDQWFFDWSGVTKKDINKTDSALNKKFDLKLADEVAHHLKKEELHELETLVHQMNPNCIDYILEKAAYALPGDTCESKLRFFGNTEDVNGKKVGTATIKLWDNQVLSFSTDPSVPPKAYQWKRDGWFKGHWEKANPEYMLDDMGDEARKGRLHHIL